MSLEITHPEKPTIQNKIDDNDYMLPHHIEGVLPDFSGLSGNKIRLPVLIEEKTVTSQNSVTFSNLNGNQDILYYIQLDGKIEYTSGNPRIFCYPNNDSGNKNTTSIGANTGGNPFRWSGDPLMLAANNAGSPTYVLSEAYFSAKTGSYRKWLSRFTTHRNGNEIFIVENGGFYTETATNITSLVILNQLAGHLFTGTIKLYKIVDINLEDLTPT